MPTRGWVSQDLLYDTQFCYMRIRLIDYNITIIIPKEKKTPFIYSWLAI